MALTDADILVIILVIQTVRPAHQPLTPEAAAVRPVTDVIQRLVTILMRPVARLTVTKPDVLAELIPVLTVVAVQELAVLLALILNRLLPPLPVALVVPAAAQAVDAPDTNPANQNSLKLKTMHSAKSILHRITEETVPLKLEGHA